MIEAKTSTGHNPVPAIAVQKPNPALESCLPNSVLPTALPCPTRKYLREFLMDGRVIDIPLASRTLLVNGIIAPFRAPKSAKVYKEVWTERGSPLKFYSEDIVRMLQEKLGGEYFVVLGMRYQNPSLDVAWRGSELWDWKVLS